MKRYFKKFSIALLMLLSIIGVGVIQNGTVANAATIGQQLIQPEDGWRRVENTNSNINYIGENWELYNNSTESGGNTSYTFDLSEASVKFNFTGNKIRIINPINTHNDSIDVYIDGIKVDNHSLSGSNLRQVIVYENMGLNNSEHYFEYKSVGTGEAVFDAVDIDSSGIIKPYNENINDISLNKSSINLTEGTSEQLTATTTPAAVTVNWKSSDESIATVDSNGKVTAIKEGQATITATMTDGSNASDSCIVNVIPKDTEPTEPDPTEQEYIINTAYAKGDNTNNGSGSVTIIFHGSADTTLSVIKTADVEEVWVGDNFTYTIVVTNTGSETAKDVVIRDSAPNHIEFNVDGITTTQGEVDSSSTSSNLKVNVGDIPAGGTVTVKIPVTVV